MSQMTEGRAELSVGPGMQMGGLPSVRQLVAGTHEELLKLRELVSNLDDRLSPVLAREESENMKAMPSDVTPSASELCGLIHDNIEIIQQIQRRVNDLTTRVTL